MSFDMDFTPVLAMASSLFNGLWPVFTIPLGLILAFAIINWIFGLIAKRIERLGG